MHWGKIATAISDSENIEFKIEEYNFVTGGDINSSWFVKSNKHKFFVKTNKANHIDMLQAEKASLIALQKVIAIRIPRPITCGTYEDISFFVMEYIPLSSVGDSQLMGRRLARLHKSTSNYFGWQDNNYIGLTPQINGWRENWLDFWREKRFGNQLSLAREKGLAHTTISRCEKLITKLDNFFQSYKPIPSLLHGDLWSGNAAYDEKGSPVIFDPACYFGDREADIAMTELFGGFDNNFYAAYNEAWPLDEGYKIRKDLYNLYHILNHFNLFGSSYEQQADHIVQKLLAEF